MSAMLKTASLLTAFLLADEPGNLIPDPVEVV